MTEESRPSKVSPFFRSFSHFSVLAMILGFVVDFIAIVSILLGIQVSGRKLTFIFSSIKITPLHALVVWILAAFTYVGFLQFYWDRNKTANHLRPTFWTFLKHDLVIEFKKPFLLLPAVILAITFVWISVEIGVLTKWGCVWGPLFIGFFILALVAAVSIESGKQARIQAFQEDVDKDWKEWEDRIRTTLYEKKRVSTLDLQASAELWDIDTDDLKYVLAKYATAHPEVTYYGEEYGGATIERV